MYPYFLREESQVNNTPLIWRTVSSQIPEVQLSKSHNRVAATEYLAWDTCKLLYSLNQVKKEKKTWLILMPVGLFGSSKCGSHSDVVFVAIDFGGTNAIVDAIRAGRIDSKPRGVSVGVSIFDTRSLPSPSVSGVDVFKTYNIGVGGCPSQRRLEEKRFLFGTTTWLPSLAGLKPALESLIDRSRNIVIVGHGFGPDLTVLRELGVDLQHSIMGIIDTARLAEGAATGEPTRGDFRLKNVLARFGCILEGFHTSGNDANYALRALLLLAAESFLSEGRDITDVQVSRVNSLRDFALAPVPNEKFME